MLTLYQVRSCFLKLFKTNMFLSHSNEPSSLSVELIDRFLSEGKIGFKLIKIHLCDVKMPVMRAESMTPATAKMEFFVTIATE